MLDDTVIDSYLDDVDRYLDVDRTQRRRVLEEIEGHLHDAVEAHIARGTPPCDAMQHAMAELGSPEDVATQFSPARSPTRSVRGWRRWMPLALPAAVLTIWTGFSAWNLLMLRHGWTRGLEVALWHTLLPTAVVAVLVAATYVAIQKADRDPAWRRASWLLASLVPFVVLASYSA